MLNILNYNFYTLHFAEDDVHVSAGDTFAVDHLAILAQLGKVLPGHVLPRGFGVSMHCKFLERHLNLGQRRRLGSFCHAAGKQMNFGMRRTSIKILEHSRFSIKITRVKKYDFVEY